MPSKSPKRSRGKGTCKKKQSGGSQQQPFWTRSPTRSPTRHTSTTRASLNQTQSIKHNSSILIETRVDAATDSILHELTELHAHIDQIKGRYGLVMADPDIKKWRELATITSDVDAGLKRANAMLAGALSW